jgi:hypothetical protein
MYRVEGALLVVHEIDSGFWREWEVLGLPGGVAGFLAVHVPLVIAVLWGGERLAAGARAGIGMALAVGAAGLLTVAVHGALLAAGSRAFGTPPSLVLLGLIGALAVPLLVLAMRTSRSARGRARRGGGRGARVPGVGETLPREVP